MQLACGILIVFNWKLEKEQKRATKLVLTVKKLCYEERLRKLKLPTLKYRRIRGDMIEALKILIPFHYLLKHSLVSSTIVIFVVITFNIALVFLNLYATVNCEI